MKLFQTIRNALAVGAGQVAIPLIQRLPERTRVISSVLPVALPGIQPNLNPRMIEQIERNISGRRKFRFAVLGDTGKTYRVFSEVLKRALDQKPDFIIFTGDTLRSPKFSNYRRLLQIIQPLSVPMIFVGGNHDLKRDGRRFFSYVFGPTHFSFDIGGYRFIILDTEESVGENSGGWDTALTMPENQQYPRGVSMMQLASLSNMLHSEKRHFLFMHRPPVGTWTNHCFKNNAADFINIVSSHASSVSRVFCGHLHGYGKKHHRGVSYIISAGCGGSFRQHDPDIIEQYNFVIVEVDNKVVKDIVYFCDV